MKFPKGMSTPQWQHFPAMTLPNTTQPPFTQFKCRNTLVRMLCGHPKRPLKPTGEQDLENSSRGHSEDTSSLSHFLSWII